NRRNKKQLQNTFMTTQSSRTMNQASLAQRLLAATLLATAVTSALAQPTYSVTDLGTLPGTSGSVAHGLNDRGDVVGHCIPGVENFNEVGFIWRNGVMTSTGKLPGGLYS